MFPYYEIGNIEDFKASPAILNSLLGQVILAYLQMFDKIGLIHRDLTPGNVVVDHIDYPRIFYQYSDIIYEVITHGYRAIIIDFGNSLIKMNDRKDRELEWRVGVELLYFIEQVCRIKKIHPDLINLIRSNKIKSIPDLLNTAIQFNLISIE